MCRTATVGRDSERDNLKLSTEKQSGIKPQKPKEEEEGGDRLIYEERASHCDHKSTQLKTNKCRNYPLSYVHIHTLTPPMAHSPTA